MSDARGEILGRIRTALTGTAGAGPVPIPREYRTTTDDGLDTFLERLRELDADVSRSSTEALCDAVRNALRDGGLRRVVVPDGIPAAWTAAVEVLRDDPPLALRDLDAADGVLTTCALAIAQTGTIVLDGSPGMGRRALSLVPDRHLCVVRSEQLVSSVPEAIAALQATRPLTFFTGPSATVDIEMVRVSGVHGPRRLHVIVAG